MGSRPKRRAAVAGAALALALGTGCVTTDDDAPERRASTDAAAPVVGARPVAVTTREHEELRRLVGRWDLEIVDLRRGDPGRVVARGRGRIEARLGGRYLFWETTVGEGDDAQQGAGILGFDAASREYEFLWISSRTTGIPVARGEGVLFGRGIELHVEGRDPRTGRPVAGTTLLRAAAPDDLVVEQYGLDATGELRVMTRTRYRRVAP